MAARSFAPTFDIPEREIVAIEHPMVVKNIDNGLKTLGRADPFKLLMSIDGPGSALPLYLRPADPTCAPILSHNAPTSNVVLKITVPKRTGRKRKRGSQELYAFQTPEDEERAQAMPSESDEIPLRSHSRLDDPQELLRSLKDNVGVYKVEVVGVIEQTHRYRTISDFHFATTGPFMNKFNDNLMDGTLESIKKFKFNPSRGVVPNEEIIAPPIFSAASIPFNWSYFQNPNIKHSIDPRTGQKSLRNVAIPNRLKTIYIPADSPTVPAAPLPSLPSDRNIRRILPLVKAALDKRPAWTRRALANHLNLDMDAFRGCIEYVGYQFTSGPWRDSIIRLGLDPRRDPEMRKYQTLVFMIHGHGKTSRGGNGEAWADSRAEYSSRLGKRRDRTSHCFDGQSFGLDGKVWQLVDISDSLLVELIETPNIRTVCDVNDGWYCNGTMSKMKAVMRTKLSAIQVGRRLLDKDFEKTMAIADHWPEKKNVRVPVPSLKVNVGRTAGSGLDEALKKATLKGTKHKVNREGVRVGGSLKGKEKEVAGGEEDAEGGEEMDETGDGEQIDETGSVLEQDTQMQIYDPEMDEHDEDSLNSDDDDDEGYSNGAVEEDEDMDPDIDDKVTYGYEDAYNSDGIASDY